MIDLGEAKGDIATCVVNQSRNRNPRRLHSHLVIPRRTANPTKLFRVHRKRVLTVPLEHGKRLLVVDLPHPVGIAWDPYFREGDELAACVAGFFDEVDGLLDAGFEVEPAGLGSDLYFDQMGFVGESEGGNLHRRPCTW